MFRRTLLAGVFATLVIFAPAAHSSTVVTAFGPRAGLSVDPDQLVLGGQLSLQEFAPDWSLDPNLELGFGDGATTIALALDAHYHLRLRGSEWRPYLGAGFGVAFVSWNSPLGVSDRSDTNLGLNVVGGVSVPMAASHRGFLELRFGVGDLPTLKIVAGLNFGR